MEVLVAILVLAFAVSTVLGLQSSLAKRSFRDRNQRQAMLVARSILAAIEMDPSKVEKFRGTKRATELMSQIVPQKQTDKDAAAELENYMAALDVAEREVFVPPTPDGLPQFAMMKEIRLKIFWGEDIDDELDVIYFAPANPKTGADGKSADEEEPA